MIIKNFLGAGYEDASGTEEFRVSWDYISLENGQVIGPKNFAIPDNLITEEFVLGWDITNDLPLYVTAGTAVQNPIAWYTDTFFLEYYFISADAILVEGALKLRVPNSYNSAEVSLGAINVLEQFRVGGKNFPGQAVLADKKSTNRYPGLLPQVGSVPLQDQQASSVFYSLTSLFTDDIEKQDWRVRNSWETDFGPQSGTEFSLNMFGLDRSDYAFITDPLRKDAVVATLPTTAVPTNYVFVALDTFGNIVGSLNSLSDFKYGPVYTPADLAVTVIDLTVNKSAPTKSVIYNADSTEGTTLSYTSQANLVLSITLSADRYEPEVHFPTAVLSTDFKRGFKYTFPSAQSVFPSGFINLTPTTGKFPYDSTRPYNVKPHGFGVFNGKNTRHAAEFFFKLFRLRRGRQYDSVLDVISVGPNDLDLLELWDLPTLVVESNFTADSIVGYDTNCVSIRLPFSYVRGQREWALAHDICKAFLQNYTIGYHEFVAEFSAAEEPVFTITDFFQPTPQFSAYFKSTTASSPSSAIDAYISSVIFANSTITQTSVNTDFASTTITQTSVNTDFASTTVTILLNTTILLD